MEKDLKHIIAYSKKREKHLDLYYKSISEAKKHNSSLIKFRSIGVVK